MANMENSAMWPGWETVRLIGRGSFGAVYEIERDVLGEKEKAALKVISIPQSDSDISEMYSDGYDDESITSTFKEHLKSIVAEYSLMRKLNGSANVVNCDDVRYVQHDDGFGWDIFIKMELLTPLTSALPAEVSEEQVIKIAKDLCHALVQCKQFGIIHRDIKPQNIFVSPLGDYKLGDFGIAKTVEKTSGGTKIGTYKYMAPEVYNNQPYGAGADIYSLGLVLYWLLNEHRMPFLPLPPEKLLAGLEEHARLRRFNGDQIPAPAHGSEALKRIVLKACAYDPKARYQSAAEMLRALEMVGEPSHATTSISSNQSVKNGDSESVDDEATVSAQLSFSRSNEEIEVPSVDGQLENNASATHELDQQSTEADETIGAFDSRTPQAPKAPTQNADSTTSQKKKGSHIWIALCVVAVAVAIIAFIKGHSTIQPTGTLNPTAVAQTTDNVVTPTEVPVAYDVIYAGWNFEALNGNECIPTLDEPVFNCTGLILQMTIAEYTGNPFGEWHLTVKQEDGTLKTAGVFQIPNDIVVGEMREYEFSFNEPLDIYGLGICSNIDSLSTIKYNEEYINVIGTVSNKSSTISSVLKSIDSVQKVGFLIARDENAPADFLFIQRCEEICLSQGIPYIIKTNVWGG